MGTLSLIWCGLNAPGPVNNIVCHTTGAIGGANWGFDYVVCLKQVDFKIS